MSDENTPQNRVRAQALSPEDRRAMIIRAVIPVLEKEGVEVTSRTLAEAAGVAEGTLFRAFGTKNALIEAALHAHLDPQSLLSSLRELDTELALDEVVDRIIDLLQAYFRSVMRVRALVWNRPGGRPHSRIALVPVLAEVFDRYADQLSISADTLAAFVRMVSLSSIFPLLNEGREFSTDELARMLLYGALRGAPAGSRKVA